VGVVYCAADICSGSDAFTDGVCSETRSFQTGWFNVGGAACDGWAVREAFARGWVNDLIGALVAVDIAAALSGVKVVEGVATFAGEALNDGVVGAGAAVDSTGGLLGAGDGPLRGGVEAGDGVSLLEADRGGPSF